MKKRELWPGVKLECTETLQLNNQKLIVKLDTGADCNVKSCCDLEALKTDNKGHENIRRKLMTYSSHKMSPLGKQCHECQYRDMLYTLELQVILLFLKRMYVIKNIEE